MSTAFGHITVPVDGSTTAERGVAFALELAHGEGLVSFCSVVDPTSVCLTASYGVAIDPGPMLTALEDDAAEFCRRAQARAAGTAVATDVAVLHGQCVSAIESLVRRNGSQAIVIGTHGRTGVARNALGSVAEGLLRQSDIPVVSVHEDDLVRTGPIAVAFDESPAAHAALGTAIAIASARGTPIALIHARDTRAADPNRLNALLAGAAQRAHALGVSAEVVIREGRAPQALLSAADELECCMIVMGTHGRAFFQRLVLGSVAAYIVEHARIPVVTIRRTTARSRRADPHPKGEHMSTLHDFTTVACPYEEVPGRLQAYLERHDAVLSLRLPVGDLRLERDVEVRLAPKPGYPGYKLLDVSWTPKGGGPYPAFTGTLTVADEGAGWSRIELDGAYAPPFGVVGAAVDAAIGHRVAAATASELLVDIKRILTQPAVQPGVAVT